MHCVRAGCTRLALRDSNYCAEHQPRRPRAGSRKKAPAKKHARKTAKKKK